MRGFGRCVDETMSEPVARRTVPGIAQPPLELGIVVVGPEDQAVRAQDLGARGSSRSVFHASPST
jgi:hypothetical protein